MDRRLPAVPMLSSLALHPGHFANLAHQFHTPYPIPHTPYPVPYLSIVIPFYNEEECLVAVCEEVRGVMDGRVAGGWELVMVDDGSRDKTPQLIDELAAKHPEFRAVHLIPNSGQSAALEAGFRAARGEVIGTLDGDGQNDPADLLPLIEEMKSRGVDMMCGVRARRADNWVRRASSRIANRIRARVLGDNITDVGCSMRVFKRGCLQNIGFFRNAHRYFPALFIMRGFRVAETPVKHRVRSAGMSKYGGGINSRLWVGIADLLGVYWMKRRALKYATRESKGAGDGG
ncbi:glycosyltransferase family 2 protein [soil metagenome]